MFRLSSVAFLLLQAWLSHIITADTLAADNEYVTSGWTVHPCKRTCEENQASMNCYYNFEVTQYSSMNRACFNCPNNITDCFDSECVPADGIKKAMLVVNKQFPGPTIEVCKGDRIIVNVKNKLTSESTSIHWHGLRQRGTPFMDGVPFITQCPILPGQTFRYDFFADTAGSLLWHSHSLEQRADGMFGALIVREPAINHLYDVDEHVIVLNEWTEKSASDSFALDIWGRLDPGPYNILINGLGRYPPNSPQMPLAVFEVEQGKKYRFRFIDSGSQDCPMSIKIDNHEMLVISSDGNDFEPVKADTIRLLSGERFDIVIEANQDIDNYWIVIKGIDGDVCEINRVHQFAILRYKGAPEVDPSPPVIYDNLSSTGGRQLNPFNAVLNTSLSITTLNSLVPDDIANTREPDQQFYISYGSYRANKDKYINNALRRDRYYDLPVRSGRTLWQLNHINFQLPPVPLLTQFDMINPSILCNASTVTDCFSKYCQCTHVLEIKLNSVVELVIVDEGSIDVNHPMHLHGHHFRVVGMGRLEEEVTADLIKQLDKEGKIERKLEGAPLKDTVMVPSNGYTIVRFHADNPGFWLFHCHFERHAHVGMELVFKVGEVKDFPQVPENFSRC